MSTKKLPEAQNPLILRCHRIMDAFAKANDERDFYLDRYEGFMVYVDLDKSQEDLDALEKELKENSHRYCMIPKLTFYETKKIMEGFVNEKVYDIDIKEKLLDIIQSQEARENFLEFVYDHHSEWEKWQQYYQERSRIRIIEWLRNNNFHFVFEEDVDMAKNMVEKLKQNLFQSKVGKDIQVARKNLIAKAKTYYSNEALNPRPKRGRPPKQIVKHDIEPQITTDIYTTVPSAVRLFLYAPDIANASAITFSSKFESEEDLLAHRRQHGHEETTINLEEFNQKLASLRTISSKWTADIGLDLQLDKEAPKPFDFEIENEPVSSKTKATKPKVAAKPSKTNSLPSASATKGKAAVAKASPPPAEKKAKSPPPVVKKSTPEKDKKATIKRIIPQAETKSDKKKKKS